MTIPDHLFSAMDNHHLTPQARLLLVDCIRRALFHYPGIGDNIHTARPIRVAWRDGRLGMTRPRFAAARKELMRAGFLRSYYNERTAKAERDWFVFQDA